MANLNFLSSHVCRHNYVKCSQCKRISSNKYSFTPVARVYWYLFLPSHLTKWCHIPDDCELDTKCHKKLKPHKTYDINETTHYNMPGHQPIDNLHILCFPCTGNWTGNTWASSHMKTNGLSHSPTRNFKRYSSWGRQSTMFTYPRRQPVG
jgi:hypothetical protein